MFYQCRPQGGGIDTGSSISLHAQLMFNSSCSDFAAVRYFPESSTSCNKSYSSTCNDPSVGASVCFEALTIPLYAPGPGFIRLISMPSPYKCVLNSTSSYDPGTEVFDFLPNQCVQNGYGKSFKYLYYDTLAASYVFDMYITLDCSGAGSKGSFSQGVCTSNPGVVGYSVLVQDANPLPLPSISSVPYTVVAGIYADRACSQESFALPPAPEGSCVHVSATDINMRLFCNGSSIVYAESSCNIPSFIIPPRTSPGDGISTCMQLDLDPTANISIKITCNSLSYPSLYLMLGPLSNPGQITSLNSTDPRMTAINGVGIVPASMLVLNASLINYAQIQTQLWSVRTKATNTSIFALLGVTAPIEPLSFLSGSSINLVYLNGATLIPGVSYSLDFAACGKSQSVSFSTSPTSNPSSPAPTPPTCLSSTVTFMADVSQSAPALLSVVMWSSATGLDINFDRATNQPRGGSLSLVYPTNSAAVAALASNPSAGFGSTFFAANLNEMFDCSNLLNLTDPRLTFPGTGALCYWSRNNTLSVLFGSTPRLNTLAIGVLGGFIRDSNFSVTSMVDSSISFALPRVLPVVTAVISGLSSRMSNCDNLTLSAYLSTGSLYQPFSSVAWALGAGTVPPQPALAALLAALPASSNTVAVPASLLTFAGGSSSIINFTLTVTNWLGIQSSTFSITNFTTSLVPSLSTAQALVQTVYCNQSYQLITSASLPSCPGALGSLASNTTISYSWQQTSGSAIAMFASAALITRTLNLPAYVLLPGQVYSFTVTATASVVGSVSNSLMFQFTTASSSPVALLVGGSFYSVSDQMALNLDASQSYIPDFAVSNNAAQSSLTFSWSCARVISSSCSSPILAALATCGSASTCNISPTLLTPSGSDYFIFTVTTFAGLLSSTCSQTVQVVAGLIPQISLSVAPNLKGLPYIPVSTVVGLTAQITYNGTLITPASPLYSQLTFLWSCDMLNVTTASLNGLLLTSPASPNFALASGTLIQGTKYTFQLITYFSPSQIATASLAIITSPTAPSGGSCSASPASGTGTTAFTLSCSDWVPGALAGSTAQNTLTYQFIAQPFTGISVSIGSASQLPSLVSLLPAGISSNGYTLPINVWVTDTFGSFTMFSFTVVVQPAPLDVSASLNSIRSSQAAGDAASLLSTVATYATATSSDQSSVNAVQKALFSALKDFSSAQTNQSTASDHLSIIQMTGLILNSGGDFNASLNSEAAALISSAATQAYKSISSATSASQNSQQLINQLTSSTLHSMDTALISSNTNSNVTSDFSSHDAVVNNFVSVTTTLSRVLTYGNLPGQTGSEVASTNILLRASLATGALLASSSHKFSTQSELASGVTVQLPAAMLANQVDTSRISSNTIASLYSSPDIFSRSSEASASSAASSDNSCRGVDVICSRVVTFSILNANGEALNMSTSNDNWIWLTVPTSQISGVPGETSNGNATISYLPKCLYWDDVSLTWSDYGVNSSSTNVSATGYSECRTRHLTSFSTAFVASLAPHVNTLSASDFLALSWGNIKKYPVPLATLGVLFCLYLILMIILFPHDRNLWVQATMELLTSTNPIHGDLPLMWETWIESEANGLQDLTFSRKNHLVKYRGRHSLRETRELDIELAKLHEAPILFNETSKRRIRRKQNEHKVKITCPFVSATVTQEQLHAFSQLLCSEFDVEPQVFKLSTEGNQLSISLTGVMPDRLKKVDENDSAGELLTTMHTMPFLALLNFAEEMAVLIRSKDFTAATELKLALDTRFVRVHSTTASIKTCMSRFCLHACADLKNDHPYIAVFSHENDSRFKSTARLTVILAWTTTALMMNAIFFGTSIGLGLLAASISSALVAFVVVHILFFLFGKAKFFDVSHVLSYFYSHLFYSLREAQIVDENVKQGLDYKCRFDLVRQAGSTQPRPIRGQEAIASYKRDFSEFCKSRTAVEHSGSILETLEHFHRARSVVFLEKMSSLVKKQFTHIRTLSINALLSPKGSPTESLDSPSVKGDNFFRRTMAFAREVATASKTRAERVKTLGSLLDQIEEEECFKTTVLEQISKPGEPAMFLMCRLLSPVDLAASVDHGLSKEFYPTGLRLAAYIFSFLWVIGSSMLVLVYGMQFDLHRSSYSSSWSFAGSWDPASAWLFTNFISLLEDAILITPISITLQTALMILAAQGPCIVARTCLDLGCDACSCKSCTIGCGTVCCGSFGCNNCCHKKTFRCCRKLNKKLQNKSAGVIRVTDELLVSCGLLNIVMDGDADFNPFEYEAKNKGRIERPTSANSEISSTVGLKRSELTIRPSSDQNTVEMTTITPQKYDWDSLRSISNLPADDPPAALHIQINQPISQPEEQNMLISPPFKRATFPGQITDDEEPKSREESKRPTQHKTARIDEIVFDSKAGVIMHHTNRHDYYYPADDENAILDLDRVTQVDSPVMKKSPHLNSIKLKHSDSAPTTNRPGASTVTRVTTLLLLFFDTVCLYLFPCCQK